MSENTGKLVTQFKVQINYKSGQSHVAWFDKFEVSSSSYGEIQGLSWKLSKGEQNIIYL